MHATMTKHVSEFGGENNGAGKADGLSEDNQMLHRSRSIGESDEEG